MLDVYRQQMTLKYNLIAMFEREVVENIYIYIIAILVSFQLKSYGTIR